jgi:hypothetical protein
MDCSADTRGCTYSPLYTVYVYGTLVAHANWCMSFGGPCGEGLLASLDPFYMRWHRVVDVEGFASISSRAIKCVEKPHIRRGLQSSVSQLATGTSRRLEPHLLFQPFGALK